MAKITFYYTDNTYTELNECGESDVKRLEKFLNNSVSVDDAKYIISHDNKINQAIFLRHVKYVTIEEDK